MAMRTLRVLVCLLPALCAAADDKPNVHVLATGGTIAGVAASDVDKAYQPAKLTVQTLLASVPPLAGIAEIDGEQVAQIASQDMDDAIWLKLGRRVNELLVDPDVDGIVITHGTDTVEETAYFLELISKSDKPVVLTGAMRPATSLSADGPLNLYNAVALAAHPDAAGRGVLVVADDAVHFARDVTKANTTRVDAFMSPNSGPIGEIYYGKPRFYRVPSRAGDGFDLAGLEALPRVDIVYAHTNMDGRLIDAAAEIGAEGLVIAGTGNGNMSQAALAAVKRAIDKGVVVVRSNRTGSGETTRNHEINDDKLGTVAADNLNPQKARVLLKLALTRTHEPRELQEIFYRY